MKATTLPGRGLLYGLYHLYWQAIDLLLPPNCGGCGRTGYRWCPVCQGSVHPPDPPLCVVCGQSSDGAGSRCTSCETHAPGYSQLRSWSVFVDPIRPALHRLKYRGDIGLAEALVPQLASFAGTLNWNADLLVPVPLGRGRRRQRGYNQAGLISWPLSLALDIRHAPAALKRTRDTVSQVGLSPQQRRENVRGAFSASPRWVAGRSVLLLDDVATTGATLSSCAEALLGAGASDVFALTVARALHRRVGGDNHGSTELEFSSDALKEAI